MSFPGDWPGKCMPEPPPGCFWTNQQPAVRYQSFTVPIQPGISWEHRYLDCDCRLTGKCAVGEPPPPPIAEFRGDTEELYPDDLEGPHAFPESSINPYEYYGNQWSSPFTHGPSPNGMLAPHGPALKKRGRWAEWEEVGGDVARDISKFVIDEIFKFGANIHGKAKRALRAATNEEGEHILSRYKRPVHMNATEETSAPTGDEVREQHHA